MISGSECTLQLCLWLSAGNCRALAPADNLSLGDVCDQHRYVVRLATSVGYSISLQWHEGNEHPRAAGDSHDSSLSETINAIM